MKFIESLKQKAKHLKKETYAIYLASRDPRVPWYAKILMFIIIAYALSPIDLIPDFIPFVGYLDDLVIVPAGILIVIKMIPREVMDECREKANHVEMTSKGKWVIAGIIILIWLLVLLLLFRFVFGIFFD